MSHIIEGVTFSYAKGAEGESIISVASRPDACPAVEFLAETEDGAWASEVKALRVGVSISVPVLRKASAIKIRLFNDVGKELLFEANRLVESASRSEPGSSFFSGNFGAKFLAPVIIILSVFAAFYAYQHFSSKNQAESSDEWASAPSVAILSRIANLRAAPEMGSNVISKLPFGTQLIPIGQSGDFLEVQVFGGARGFVHKKFAGEANRVRELGLRDSLEQARLVKDTQRASILNAARQAQMGLASASVLSADYFKTYETTFSEAIAETTGDDISGRYFHFLAEEANSRGNFKDAVVYFRAAALSNPISVGDVHGWGITQINSNGTVDETAVLHAVVVAPQATNTWLMMASQISMNPSNVGDVDVANTLRVAAALSINPAKTKTNFTKLSQSTSNELLRDALIEVVAEM
jgi:Bacterial SH3 domain